jgi:hypothetical protein
MAIAYSHNKTHILYIIPDKEKRGGLLSSQFTESLLLLLLLLLLFILFLSRNSSALNKLGYHRGRYRCYNGTPSDNNEGELEAGRVVKTCYISIITTIVGIFVINLGAEHIIQHFHTENRSEACQGEIGAISGGAVCVRYQSWNKRHKSAIAESTKDYISLLCNNTVL